ncbi:MAG: oligosaccharide flippase family protein [Candidatus Thorarchaeota archaeon]|nr:oligosaccharide flippase family protein [Candidatus Thorarchaeota archaeon]
MSRQKIGRGALVLAISQGVFIITAYLIQFILGRILGPQDYGTYGVVLSTMNVGLIAVSSGIPLTISKYVAQNGMNSRFLKDAYRIGFILALLIYATYFIISYPLAIVYNDSSITVFIQVCGFVLLTYSLFAIVTNQLNGLQQFDRQSWVQMSYHVIRFMMIVGFVLGGFSIIGALLGNAISPIFGFIIGIIIVRSIKPNQEKEDDVSSHEFNIMDEFLKYSVPIIAFSIAFNLMSNLDLWAVKALITASAEAAGYYNAAYQLGRVPLYAGQALAAAVFPAIARAQSKGNIEELSSNFGLGIKYMTVIGVIVSLGIIALSGEFIEFVFGVDYAPAQIPLMILSIALVCQSVMGISLYALNASNYPKIATYLCGFLIVVDLALLLILVPLYGLVGAALSTVGISILGLFLSVILSIRKMSIKVPREIGVMFILFTGFIILVTALIPLLPVGAIELVLIKIGCIGFFVLVLFASKAVSIKEIWLLFKGNSQ